MFDLGWSFVHKPTFEMFLMWNSASFKSNLFFNGAKNCKGCWDSWLISSHILQTKGFFCLLLSKLIKQWKINAVGVFSSSWKDSWQWAGSHIKQIKGNLQADTQSARMLSLHSPQATSLYSLQQENLQTLGAEIERLIKQQRSWRWSKKEVKYWWRRGSGSLSWPK